jgi:hypothetical protein
MRCGACAANQGRKKAHASSFSSLRTAVRNIRIYGPGYTAKNSLETFERIVPWHNLEIVIIKWNSKLNIIGDHRGNAGVVDGSSGVFAILFFWLSVPLACVI